MKIPSRFFEGDIMIEKIQKEIERLRKDSPLYQQHFNLKIVPPKGEFNTLCFGENGIYEKIETCDKWTVKIGHNPRFNIKANTQERALNKLYAVLKNTKCTGWSFRNKGDKK